MKAFVNGIPLAYHETGHGPAVLLLHSSQGNRRMWDSQVGPLAEAGFRVIAPDFRGFGETPGKGEVTPAAIADDMAALLHYLGIGRVVLVGQGLGGEVLLQMLRRHRRKVAGACFLGSESPLADGSDAANEIAALDLPALVFGGKTGRVALQARPSLSSETTLSFAREALGTPGEVNAALLGFLSELKGDACCFRETQPS